MGLPGSSDFYGFDNGCVFFAKKNKLPVIPVVGNVKRDYKTAI